MITLDTAQNALKTIYLEAISNQLNKQVDPVFSMIKQSSADVYGRNIIKLVPIGLNGGIGAGDEAGALPESSDSRYVNFTTSLKNLYGMIEISDKAIRALNWAVKEMRRRIEYFAQLHFRDIDEYNRNCAQIGCEKMPRIIIIADEFADLMATGKKAVEEAVNAIARLARAAGIHLILATQRPSVDVVSGTIKNNLPTRVALTLSSFADSRTVMDAGGAEKLLGYGDLFYLTPKSSLPVRMQGALIEPSEMNAVVDYIKEHNDAVFDDNLKKEIEAEKQEENGGAEAAPKSKKDEGAFPPEIFKALRMGLDGSPITISGMQRRLGLGFPRAAKLHDIMIANGFIAPTGDDKKNRVCLTEEEIDALESGGDVPDGGEEDGGEE